MGQQKPSGCCNFEAEVSFPDFASLASAYIIISLKLLFGIDDVTEKSVLCYYTSLQNIILNIKTALIIAI
jgi:hypothetical protein